MNPVGYLLDEHTPRFWVSAVGRVEPAIRVSRVGQPDAPVIGTGDPELLKYCESNRLVLVTADRRSMYQHIADHTAAGHVFYGMLVVGRPITVEELVNDLVLIHLTSHAEDLIDTVFTLPL